MKHPSFAFSLQSKRCGCAKAFVSALCVDGGANNNTVVKKDRKRPIRISPTSIETCWADFLSECSPSLYLTSNGSEISPPFLPCISLVALNLYPSYCSRKFAIVGPLMRAAIPCCSSAQLVFECSREQSHFVQDIFST